MSVGFVAMVGHHNTVENDIEFTVGPGRKLKVVNVLTSPVQRLSRHPGGTKGMTSILAIQNLQFHLFIGSHGSPPKAIKDTSIIFAADLRCQ